MVIKRPPLLRLRAVLAADSPLSTAKQWCVRLNLEKPIQEISPYQHKQFEELLGMRGGTIGGERLYYRLVERANRPTMIMAGTLPPFPSMPTLPLAAKIPSFVDDVDSAFFDQIDNKFVSVKRIKIYLDQTARTSEWPTKTVLRKRGELRPTVRPEVSYGVGLSR